MALYRQKSRLGQKPGALLVLRQRDHSGSRIAASRGRHAVNTRQRATDKCHIRGKQIAQGHVIGGEHVIQERRHFTLHGIA